MTYYLTQAGALFLEEDKPKTDLRSAFDDAYDKAYDATKGDHGKKSDAGHAAGNEAHQKVLDNMKPMKYKGSK